MEFDKKDQHGRCAATTCDFLAFREKVVDNPNLATHFPLAKKLGVLELHLTWLEILTRSPEPLPAAPSNVSTVF